MNCKNCGYGLKQRCGDFEKIICTYEEGECVKITELEKENAELKDYRLTTLAKQQTENQKYTVNLEHKLSWYDDQLTKAKEILREYIRINLLPPIERNFDDEVKLFKQAEQFLNSEVEK